MKALIVGARGQLGRELRAAAPAACVCVALGSDQMDITDATAVERAMVDHRPDLILNAAAWTAVDRAESEQDAAFAVNAGAVANLARAAASYGAHLVHVSSDFVFDGRSPAAYRPKDSRNPLSAYGRSKAAGEDAAGLEATVVRTSWLYAGGSANFVTTMLRMMRERDQVRVVADQIGAPTWARGLAETLWGLGTRRLTGFWHHSDAGVASWYDFATAIAEEALVQGLLLRPVEVLPITTADYPTPARRPGFSLLDSGATRAALGTPAIHWRTNLRAMLAQEAA